MRISMTLKRLLRTKTLAFLLLARCVGSHVLLADPAPLHLAFERMGRSGIYVGDSEVDAACAAQAGIPFVLFTEGYRKTPVEDLPHMAKFSRYGDLSALLSRAAA